PALDPRLPAGREPAPGALALDREAPQADGQGADRDAARRGSRAARRRADRRGRSARAELLPRRGTGRGIAALPDGHARPALLAGAPRLVPPAPADPG